MCAALRGSGQRRSTGEPTIFVFKWFGWAENLLVHHGSEPHFPMRVAPNYHDLGEDISFLLLIRPLWAPKVPRIPWFRSLNIGGGGMPGRLALLLWPGKLSASQSPSLWEDPPGESPYVSMDFMAISWEFHGNFMGIYGCHVVAPHSIHALAAIGFRLRKLRKLPELWYDLRTDTQINIKIISNSLLLGLWSNSKWLGSGRKLCLNSMIYFRLGTKHQRTLHLLDKSILTETPGAWLFRPPLRLGGWWGNYPNYPQQTSSATHHSLWQLPIFLEWPRAAVALPASRLGPRAMDDEILEDCSGNFWVARVATVCRHLADLGCSIRGTEPLNIVWGWFEDGLMVWWCLMIFDGFWWFEVERRSTTSLVAGFKDTSSCSAAQQQSGCGKFTIQHGPVKRCKKRQLGRVLTRRFLKQFMFRV